MTISDSSKELTIYLDDKAVRDQIIFMVSFFLLAFMQLKKITIEKSDNT